MARPETPGYENTVYHYLRIRAKNANVGRWKILLNRQYR